MLEVFTKAQVRQLLEQRIAEAGGVRALARASGVQPVSISIARKPEGLIPPAITNLLGLEKNEETYVRKSTARRK